MPNRRPPKHLQKPHQARRAGSKNREFVLLMMMLMLMMLVLMMLMMMLMMLMLEQHHNPHHYHRKTCKKTVCFRLPSCCCCTWQGEVLLGPSFLSVSLGCLWLLWHVMAGMFWCSSVAPACWSGAPGCSSVALACCQGGVLLGPLSCHAGDLIVHHSLWGQQDFSHQALHRNLPTFLVLVQG